MEASLRKLKLLQDFSLTIPINGNELVKKLLVLTIPKTSLIEAISNTDKLFVGNINLTEISLRPKRTFGQRNFTYSTILIARLNSTATSVTIEGEIQLAKLYPLLMLSSLIIYFVMAAFVFVKNNSFGIVPILIQTTIMLVVFFFIYRNAIKKSKVFFEEQFLSLANNAH